MKRWTPLLLLLAFVSNGMAVAPFTVVAMPDPQNYVANVDNLNLYFKGQTNWIVSHRTSNNIAFMLALGDYQNPGNPYRAMTDPAHKYEPDLSKPTNNVSSDYLYSRASSAFDILDNAGFPYAMVAGNHDYLDHDSKIEPIYYLKWFGPSRFANKPWEHGFSGEMGSSLAGMDNYSVFDAGGRKYLNIGLQYAPDTNDLKWAQSVINSHPGMPTIVTTHAMLDGNGYQAGRKNIWDDFMRVNPQVIMSMNGHITTEFNQTETNIAGQKVHEMVVDYQAINLGGGFFRLMEFDQDASVVRVKSYSPAKNQYLTDADSQFNLAIDFNGRFGKVGRPTYTKRVTFQEGVDGYTGTRDTYIDATAPAADNSNLGYVWADKDYQNGDPRQALVKFTSIIQSGRIPAGSQIKSATLTLTTDTAGASQTGSTMGLYRMLRSWAETDTWNDKTGGFQADGADAILSANDTVAPTVVGGKVSFDVTESLYAWSMGAPVNGWTIIPNGNDGWRFVSSEGADVNLRPMLEVEYYAPALDGDANLDGVVGADDLALLDRGMAKHWTGWINGDFNLDGVVNAGDYLLFDAQMGRQGGLSAGLLAEREAQFGEGYVDQLVAAVPEPGCVGVMGIAAIGLVWRRR